MKKLGIFIGILSVIAIMILTLIPSLKESFGLISTFGVLSILVSTYIYFEKSKIGVKEIAFLGTLSGFIAMSRVVFAPLPNVKPVTFLVAATGYVFGVYEGFIVGATSAFLSNIFFGQGPWTPWQMFSWGLVGAISGVLGNKNKERNMGILKFSILCFIFGFMFDWIMNIWHIVVFLKTTNAIEILGVFISGLPFDILHGGGSFIFSMIFYEKILKIFKRYRKKLYVKRI
ncbi:energy-coupling factor transport system substrate-specific component [Clostridium cavendishii DSM 21758]|uniref:Energy-coupling factor transport system substrate-specific component n=1 Tax=Clostridium cavendishii DSM 21758 TaxID=1121302 RepID=A0A1M6J0W3_9CLOT|nr:ECF transporter S component [Clostridium cavendishii]SHJ40291.1 energy-coupling factor transport system substrate-specific component [Clostridium cavendishii DSM 21758]